MKLFDGEGYYLLGTVCSITGDFVYLVRVKDQATIFADQYEDYRNFISNDVCFCYLKFDGSTLSKNSYDHSEYLRLVEQDVYSRLLDV